MHVRLNDASYVERLESSLLAAGCVAHQVDHETIRVVHLDALDATDAQIELRFFVRAWQLKHPHVEAEMTP